MKEILLKLIQRHALLKDPITQRYGQDIELGNLLDELTVYLVKNPSILVEKDVLYCKSLEDRDMYLFKIQFFLDRVWPKALAQRQYPGYKIEEDSNIIQSFLAIYKSYSDSINQNAP